MNLLKTLLVYLGIKRSTSIDSIVKPMARIVSQLESYAQEQEEASKADSHRADELIKSAQDKLSASRKADALAKRYSSLTV